MGMSASQVRFLTLQNRKSSIGRQLTTLSNRKMALSRDMNAVAMRYNQALNQRVLKWSNDSGNSYADLSYDLMMKPNELNTSVPYIISTRDGKVVVDNKTNLLDGLDGRYSDASKTFSAESYVPDFLQGKAISFENIAKWITSEGGGKISLSEDGVVSGSESGAYVIPNNAADFGYDNTLRINIFKEMGLIDEDKMNRYYALMDELYGSAAAKNYGYGEMLKSFDYDKTQTIADSLYHDIFGKLNYDSQNGEFDFDADTGCAMGNLTLAQAYLKEYKAYLNTPIQRDLVEDGEVQIAKPAVSDLSMLDEKTALRSTTYDYDENDRLGISNRMIEAYNLLEDEELMIQSTGDVKLSPKGILNNLGFLYNGTLFDDFNAFRTSGALRDGADIVLKYDADNIGNFDQDANLSMVTNWGQLFDFDGKSYDSDNDGYYSGADYLDSDKNMTTGCAIVDFGAVDRAGNKGEKIIKDLIGVQDFLSALGNSLKTVENINTDAVDYAVSKTWDIYSNYIYKENDDGSYSRGRTMTRSTGASKEIFGGGWCNRFGHDSDGCSVNATNLISAFVTFYQMYVATDGDTSRITSGEKGVALDGNAAGVAYMFDENIAKLANRNKFQEAFDSSLDEWKSGIDPNDITTSADGTTLSYTVTEKDDDGNDETITCKAIIQKGSDGIESITYYENNKEISKIYMSGSGLQEDLYGHDDNGNRDQAKDATIYYNSSYLIMNNGVSIEFDSNNHYKAKKITHLGHTLDLSSNETGDEYNYFANSGFVKHGRYYYIMKDGNEDIQDPNYKYNINVDSVSQSVFAGKIDLYPEDKYSEKFQSLVDRCQARVDELFNDIELLFGGADGRVMEFFDAIFERVSENGWVSDNKVNNSIYVNNKLQNNDYFVTVCQAKDTPRGYRYSNKMAESVTKIYSVYDDNAVNLALSEYETDKKAIQYKEDQIDIIMEKLETEQEAITTTLESIKRVRDDNIKKKFKMFG